MMLGVLRVAPDVALAREELSNWCAVNGCDEQQIVGKVRKRSLVIMRQAAMAYLRTLGFSFPTIGKAMNRDHATVVHGTRRHRAREKANEND